MNVLSLFDGISCGRVALDRAGVPVEKYFAYEIEQNAIKVSRKNYPDIIQCGDVMTADFTQYKNIDLLIGGSPCQSLSIVQSQTRQNLNGKSKLFFEFVRALHESKPKYFLFENVASMNDESKNIISNCLGCDPVLINSDCFSAQQRPRLYWTNIMFDHHLPTNKSVVADILQKEVDEKYFVKRPFNIIDLNKPVCAKTNQTREMSARVFNPNFKIHTLTCVVGGGQEKKILIDGKVRKLTPIEYERLQTLPDDYTAGICDGARYTCVGNGWTVDVIAHILKGLN